MHGSVHLIHAYRRERKKIRRLRYRHRTSNRISDRFNKSRRVDCKTICTDRKCHGKLVFKTRQNRGSVTRGTRTLNFRKNHHYFKFCSASVQKLCFFYVTEEYSCTSKLTYEHSVTRDHIYFAALKLVNVRTRVIIYSNNMTSKIT